MSKVKNGQYLVMADGKVIQYLKTNHEDALEWMMSHYRHNSERKPDAYLVQVQATLDYPPPTIKTIAHEVMT